MKLTGYLMTLYYANVETDNDACQGPIDSSYGYSHGSNINHVIDEAVNCIVSHNVSEVYWKQFEVIDNICWPDAFTFFIGHDVIGDEVLTTQFFHDKVNQKVHDEIEAVNRQRKAAFAKSVIEAQTNKVKLEIAAFEKKHPGYKVVSI